MREATTTISACVDCGKVPKLKNRRFSGFSDAPATDKFYIECCHDSTKHCDSEKQAIFEWEGINCEVIDISPISSNPPDAPQELTLDESQLAAVELACTSTFAIINGGAGTGKTTIIKHIADRIGGSLCAFAGKAAARLKEATGHNASTIHRLLMSNGERFLLETLHGRTVIVDEASMVASDLMAEIIRRGPARLILVGDESQLPPVGKGQPFHDLITHRPDLVAQLTTCYRNTEAVFKAATRIREGKMPEPEEQTANEKWSILKCNDQHETHRAIVGMVEDGLIDFNQDIILCPKNGDKDTPCTVKGLNEAIVNIVNPRDDLDVRLKVGDRVINTKNIAEKDVWNGTTGSVHAIDHDEAVWVRLDIPIVDQKASTPADTVYKDLVRLDKKEARKLELAYALTVHKSQGSQYRKVVVVCLTRDSVSFLLNRPLIYTAVTRTKQECIVAGQMQALFTAVNQTTNKRTIIQEMARTTKQEKAV
jgi:exodeoxyribonuclease V alpha subunit